MTLTEKHAGTRWCPFARSYDTPATLPVDVIVTSTNRKADGSPDRSCMCIASRCMAWRWTEFADELGFCGLAGRPK